MNGNTKRRFFVLDSFRGIFALIVALFHARSFIGPIGQIELIQKGDYFVDFFFVLSGFIIYHNYSKLEFRQQKDFMLKRLIRLYPLHFIILIVFVFFEIAKYFLFQYGIFHRPAFGNNNWWSFIVSLFFLQSFNLAPIAWNYPSWSISAEMVTYIVFCVIVPFIKDRKVIIKIAAFLLLIALSASLIYLIKSNFDLKLTSNYSMVRCMFGFFIGCLIHMLYQKVSTLKLPQLSYSFFEFASLIAAVVFVVRLPTSLTILLPVFFGLCILSFSFENGIISKLFRNRYMIHVGNISYSIYMTHALIAIILEIIIAMARVKSPLLLSIFAVAYLLSIVLVSSFTYRYVEVRLGNYLKSITRKKGSSTRHLSVENGMVDLKP